MTLLLVIGALALGSYATLQSVVAPAFDQLELDVARTNLVRAERAILNDMENLNAITGDWALWDDAYDFVRGEYPAFRDSNLDRPTLTNLDLNLLAIYDVAGNLIWGQVAHQQHIQGIEKLGVLNPEIETSSFLITHTDPSGQIYGLLRTDLGPMMFSSWPVLRSDGGGEISGSMIMGQFLDDERAASMQRRTEVELRWMNIDEIDDIGENLAAPLNGMNTGSVVHKMTRTTVKSYGTLSDLFGTPLLVLEVSTPRNISALGNSTVNGALLFLALAAIIVAIVIWWLLRKIIVSPLAGLATHITAMRKSGDLQQKLGEKRNDEIGSLAHEFDKLTTELHEARKLLLDQSFKAGKADTAAEVLHNIRNAMTPMINGMDRLHKNFSVTQKLKVRESIEALTGADCPPDRVDKYFKYIESAFSHIEATNADAAENLDIATKQARQVEAILADQERHTHVAPVFELLSLDEVLHEATLVIPQVDEPAIEFDVGQEIRDVKVRAHRIGLLQVMGNLILNAFESIERSKARVGRIGVRVLAETIDDKPMVRLVVSDTGCGFETSAKEKIFQRGYSSKEGHLSGLGLHWCANALAGMGGRIYAESEGPGRGAEFHVLLAAAQRG